MTPIPDPGLPRRRPGVWRESLAAALRIDWTRVEMLTALRCTLGVGLPLVVAVLLGQPAAAMFIAIGGVSAGFGAFQGAYRSRAATIFFAAAGMAISLAVGTISGHSTAAQCAVAAAWGLGSGVLVAFGPAPEFVALQSTVAVIVAGAYPAPLHDAIGRGLLVLLGGVVQLVLTVSLWPLRRFDAERQAIANLYQNLADYAAALPAHGHVPPDPNAPAGASLVHQDPHPFARTAEVLVFRGLVDEADRIRASLAALAARFAESDGFFARHLWLILNELAAAVREGRAPAAMADVWATLDATVAARGGGDARLPALMAQLRSAARMASLPADAATDAAPATADAEPRRIRTLPRGRDVLLTLRANLTFRSAVLRHAVRMAIGLAAGTALYRWLELPRGYWLPMTLLLVLKPDFRQTYTIGIARMIGTLAGAALAALLATLLGGHATMVALLLLVFIWGGYSLFRANYVLFTVCITGYIVLLLYLSQQPGPATAVSRAVATVGGGMMALVLYRVWPTWESGRARDMLALELEALARDAEVVLGAYADPATWNPRRLRQTRSAARLARSNAEASVERLLGEPGEPRFDAGLGLSLIAACRRYVLDVLALHADLERRPPQAVPALAPVAAALVDRLRALAGVLRGERSAYALPPLAHEEAALHDPAIAEHVEGLVESVNAIADLLKA